MSETQSEPEKVPATFKWDHIETSSVQIMGDFSNWKPIKMPKMDYYYTVTLALSPNPSGIWHYVFVRNGERLIDPKIPTTVHQETGQVVHFMPCPKPTKPKPKYRISSPQTNTAAADQDLIYVRLTNGARILVRVTPKSITKQVLKESLKRASKLSLDYKKPVLYTVSDDPLMLDDGDLIIDYINETTNRTFFLGTTTVRRLIYQDSVLDSITLEKASATADEAAGLSPSAGPPPYSLLGSKKEER